MSRLLMYEYSHFHSPRDSVSNGGLVFLVGNHLAGCSFVCPKCWSVQRTIVGRCGSKFLFKNSQAQFVRSHRLTGTLLAVGGGDSLFHLVILITIQFQQFHALLSLVNR